MSARVRLHLVDTALLFGHMTLMEIKMTNSSAAMHPPEKPWHFTAP